MLRIEDLTATNIIGLIACFVMAFSMGMKFDVEDRTRKIANAVYWTSLAVVWVCILAR